MSFRGDLLKRGFWLYVWEIIGKNGRTVLYVGRTGDSSSCNAQSPFNRMGQHLGHARNSNMLRRHLERHCMNPEDCGFRLVACGPLLEEIDDEKLYPYLRDRVAALEKALATRMRNAGYDVLNEVHSRKTAEPSDVERVISAFRGHFQRLN